ncbi:hypothetical protein BDN70DRAFT_899486 [Pholiota conissans]|uniref:Uncharacterized protein n=1 Tax=Pholiota conissans TaxID=109636 RepID=A0A9P5YS92_9AGAR|nr:hypothetical protein BDN70DRAFT_899486 [Pholiota conissans]
MYTKMNRKTRYYAWNGESREGHLPDIVLEVILIGKRDAQKNRLAACRLHSLLCVQVHSRREIEVEPHHPTRNTVRSDGGSRIAMAQRTKVTVTRWGPAGEGQRLHSAYIRIAQHTVSSQFRIFVLNLVGVPNDYIWHAFIRAFLLPSEGLIVAGGASV